MITFALIGAERISAQMLVQVPDLSENRTSQVLGLYMDDFRVYRDLGNQLKFSPAKWTEHYLNCIVC